MFDLWNTERYGEDKFLQVQERFSSEIKKGKVDIIRKSSFDAAGDFSDGTFDWIYIDTDHTYQTTISELNLWHKKVKQDGYIAGHDYNVGNIVSGIKYGVVEAVAEFCVKNNWMISYLTADFSENISFAIKRL